LSAHGKTPKPIFTLNAERSTLNEFTNKIKKPQALSYLPAVSVFVEY